MSDAIPVQLKWLPHGQDLPLPAYQTAHAAGMDLHAAVPTDHPLTIAPGHILLIPCGFAIALPIGYEAQIRPRSGLALKHGISMPNTPGTIDADYRGEVMVPLINHSPTPFTVTRGLRIAQMIVAPVSQARWTVVESLDETTRGEAGFGSTGR